jgi:hypothetical protein
MKFQTLACLCALFAVSTVTWNVALAQEKDVSSALKSALSEVMVARRLRESVEEMREKRKSNFLASERVAKQCRCSDKCVCGCNEGLPCTCGDPVEVVVPAARSTYTSPSYPVPYTYSQPMYRQYQSPYAPPYQTYPTQTYQPPSPQRSFPTPVRQIMGNVGRAASGGGC